MLNFFKSEHSTYGAITTYKFKSEDYLTDTDNFLIYIKNNGNTTVTLDTITCKSNLNYKIKILTEQEKGLARLDASIVASLEYTSSSLDIDLDLNPNETLAIGLKYFNSDFNKRKNKLILEAAYL